MYICVCTYIYICIYVRICNICIYIYLHMPSAIVIAEKNNHIGGERGTVNQTISDSIVIIVIIIQYHNNIIIVIKI